MLDELEPGQRLDRGDYALEAVSVEHGLDALGYALIEQERPGRFDVAAAVRSVKGTARSMGVDVVQ